MRILLLTPFPPDPDASHGGGSYLGALAVALQAHAEVGVVYLDDDEAPRSAQRDWSYSASAPYRGAPRGAGRRLRMLWRWRRDPLLVCKYWQPQLRQQLAVARSRFAPDAVLVEMAQMAQYLATPELRGLATVLTDHEAGVPGSARTGLGTAADARDGRLWRHYLRRCYPLANIVQALTEEDAASLGEQLGRTVQVRQPTLTIPAVAVAPAAAPPRALFVGDYRHVPNVVAARRIATEVWPQVRCQRPDAELLLAGPHTAAIADLAAVDGVTVRGFVPELRELLASVRCALTPVWSGAGFRVKNATALAHGLPIVTNELGARGCRAPAPACTVAESPEGLAAATLAHLQAPAHAGAAGELGREWAQARYRPDAVARQQLELITDLLQRRRS